MRQLLLVLGTATLLLLSQVALAGEMEKAQEEYGKGTTAYEAGDFAGALAHFKEAYNLSAKPGILYNLAICHEKLEEPDRAVAYYELYLEENPDADDVDQVKAKIEFLLNPGAAPPVEEKPAEPAEKAEETEDSAGATEEAAGEADEEEAPLVVQEKEKQPPSKSRLAQGLLMGLGGVVMASGGLTAIAAYKKYDSYEAVCAPNCTEEEAKKVRGISIAADVQIFTGLAAFTAGLVWLIVEKSQGKDTLATRKWNVAATPAAHGGALVFERRF